MNGVPTSKIITSKIEVKNYLTSKLIVNIKVVTINFDLNLLFSSMENDIRNDVRRRSNHPAMTTVLKERMSKGLREVVSTERLPAESPVVNVSTLIFTIIFDVKNYLKINFRH